MNLDALLKLLLDNPALLNILRPIVEVVIRELAQELNKPDVQKSIVDAIFAAIPKNS